MPALAAVNPSAQERLIEAAASCRDAFALLSAAADDFVARHAEGGTLRVAELSAIEPAVASEAVKLLIFEAAGPRKTPLRLSRLHIEAVLRLAADPAHGTRMVRLPGGLVARRVYDTLAILRTAARPGSDGPVLPETPLVIPGAILYPSGGFMVTARIIEDIPSVTDHDHPGGTNGRPSGREQTTALLDYERISHPPAVRGRRPGDRVTLPSGAGTKKLSDLFIDQKVPVNERNLVPVLVSGKDIMWVMGWGADGRFAPTDKTRRLLSVTFTSAGE